MRRNKLSTLLAVSLIIACILLMPACGNAAGSSADGEPSITAVVAEHPTVYPLGNTNITCSASSKAGSNLSYRWICNEGIITGNGPTINWEAPKTYGDFHIMVIVDDGVGNSNSKSVAVKVIVRDPSKCCK